MNYLKKELYALIKSDDAIFDFIQESAMDGFWFWDLEKPENEWMNPKFWHTLGYDPATMPHKSNAWMDIINQDDLKLAIETTGRHLQDPSVPYDQIVRYRHKKGHTVWIRCKGLALRDENGKPLRLLGVHTDITELKNAELGLLQQVKRFEHVIAGTNIGTWEWNNETQEMIYNENWASLIGYSLDEISPITADTFLAFTHPEDILKSNIALDAHLKGETEFYECEMRMKHRDGRWVWVLDRGKTVSWTNDGKPEWVTGSHIDITERKNAFERNRMFIEQAPTAIAMFDHKMRYLAAAQRWLTDYGLEDVGILGKSHYEIFPTIEEDRRAIHQKCLAGEVQKGDEYAFRLKDGTTKWLSWEIRPWYTNVNDIGGIIIHTTDITQRKQTEEKLRISEESFRMNFEHAAIGMAILDRNGHWERLNDSLCAIIGYTQEELLKLTFVDITHPDDLHNDYKELEEMIDGKRTHYQMEKRFLHKNGSMKHVLVSMAIIKDNRSRPLYFISQLIDITPRKHAQQELKKVVAELEGLLDASTQVSFISTDAKGIITAFNSGAENLLGYSAQEIIGKKSPALFHVPSEVETRGRELSREMGEVIEGIEVFIASARSGRYETREWTYVRKDGTTFPVQLTITAIKDNKEITGYLGVATEITEIKKAEREVQSLLEVTKEQNDRLRNFAHIVSHNLRSHSGNIGMLLDLYLMDKKDADQNEIFQMLRNASDNLKETIGHLNDIVQVNNAISDNLEAIDLHAQIDKTIESVRALSREGNVSIINEVAPNTKVKGTHAYLDSIILNFITNGIKYRSGDRPSFVKLYASQEGSFHVLSIEDNGLGIDLNRHHSKLFGMYKTFHVHKDARGIGLFITKNQIEAIGGKVMVESEVDKGTIFKIYLQRHEN